MADTLLTIASQEIMLRKYLLFSKNYNSNFDLCHATNLPYTKLYHPLRKIILYEYKIIISAYTF